MKFEYQIVCDCEFEVRRDTLSQSKKIAKEHLRKDHSKSVGLLTVYIIQHGIDGVGKQWKINSYQV